MCGGKEGIYKTELSVEETSGDTISTGEQGETFMTEPGANEAPIILHPVMIQIGMDDFQRMRAAVKNAIRPEVPWMPSNIEEMKRQAELLTLTHMNALERLLDKYEYMEQEGFAGPDAQHTSGVGRFNSHDKLSSSVLEEVSNFSGFIKPVTSGFLDAYGITNDELFGFSRDIGARFKLTTTIPKEEYLAWETVNDVIEYIWNSNQ